MALQEVQGGAEFEHNVLQSKQPVLVDFWAEWCGPCRALAPKLEDVSQKWASRLRVVKLDVEKAGDTAAEYGVRGLPTMVLFQDGKVVDQLVGNQSMDNIEAFLTRHISTS